MGVSELKTVDQGFRELKFQLTTPENESLAAQSHRASIKACLEDNFGMVEFFQSGSFGNGTNIPVHSDVDRFAVIPRENLHQNSGMAVRRVCHALAQRFSKTRRIRPKFPAVVVPFGTDGLETTEIIAAHLIGTHDGEKVYAIPSPAGGTGWVYSSPKALRKYINEINEDSDNKLKPLIRFIKSWKYERKIPLQSIYIELVCAKITKEFGLTTPSVDIARILNFLRVHNLPVVSNPIGIGDPITGPNSPRQREEAINKVTGGANMATRAVTAELQWRIRPAFNLWKSLFGSFPNPE